jgi:hypothetical protein
MTDLVLPFTLRGLGGRVRVSVEANADPVRSGHHLFAVHFDAQRFRGFPVVLGRIEYAGSGLLAVMAWLQVVRHYRDGRETARPFSTRRRTPTTRT